MEQNITGRQRLKAAAFAAVFACLWCVNAHAQSPVTGPVLVAEDESAAPLFMMGQPDHGNLDFDMAGAEAQRLQLQLAQPLTLSAGSTARVLDNGNDLLGLDATLNVPLSDNFSLAAGTSRQQTASRFQALGSIRCMNGTLRADSYTASGCRFVNEPMAQSQQEEFRIGASWNTPNAAASISWFNQESQAGQSLVSSTASAPHPGIVSNHLLSPNLGNPLLSAQQLDPLQYLNGEASGVNLNFQVGIATGNQGEVQLGLAFSRMFESEYQGLYANSNNSLAWTVAQPFNTTRMNLEWSKGAFSSGIVGYYRDSVDFLNRNSIDSLATFDVHFTWRTPWNSSLSVGASNVLNAGAENSTKTDSQPIDPLESVYGRIPYVRYKQDL